MPRLAFAFFAAGLAASLPAQEPPRPDLRLLEQQMRRAIDAAEPSVVFVAASRMAYPDNPPADRLELGYRGDYRRRFNDDPRLDLSDPDQLAEHPTGSGLVLERANNGLILTSYHLIDKATRIYIRTHRGQGCYADVHAADARSDLAVLRPLEKLEGVDPVRFADVRVAQGPGDRAATVFRGMWVLALGHPTAAGFADSSATASWGILGNVRRRAVWAAREEKVPQSVRPLAVYGNLLQTDARIAIGSSGAGLFNLDGEAVGLALPLAGLDGTDAAGGFAVPFDANTRRIVDVLRQGREVEYGLLGVTLSPLGGDEVRLGVRAGRVSPGGPAARAGLTNNDVILAVDGRQLRRQDDLFLTVGAALAGNKVRLTVLRFGQPRELEVTLAKLPNELPKVASRPPDAPFGLRVDWSSVLMAQVQGGALGGELRLPPGVAVHSVAPGSPAEGRFKPLGDDPKRFIITHVDDEPVPTPAEFREATQGKPSIRLRLFEPSRIGGRERTVPLP